jgi:hypothetical protein
VIAAAKLDLLSAMADRETATAAGMGGDAWKDSNSGGSSSTAELPLSVCLRGFTQKLQQQLAAQQLEQFWAGELLAPLQGDQPQTADIWHQALAHVSFVYAARVFASMSLRCCLQFFNHNAICLAFCDAAVVRQVDYRTVRWSTFLAVTCLLLQSGMRRVERPV